MNYTMPPMRLLRPHSLPRQLHIIHSSSLGGWSTAALQHNTVRSTKKMGKKGSGTGINTKVQAAREKQAAVEGARAAKAQAAQEAAEAKEWSKGANQRGSKREDDAARKQEEKVAKLAAKKALQAQEAEQLSGFKSVVVREG